jgi:NitT/TauT family transport system substrate-binding protein
LTDPRREEADRMIRTVSIALMVAATSVAAAPPAAAQDALKVAVGQHGNWNTSVPELGQRAGIFKKHGLTLEILYTQGSGETQQAVISNSVDIGTSIGVMGALSAFAKGAPIRVIGAETTGAADYWYALASSPIKGLKDTDGRTMAYSTNGSSTHSIVLAFIKENDLKAKPVATGSPAATLTQVMSGQIDVGWAAPPFGIKEMDEGKIRLIARGGDSAVVRGQTVRVLATTADTLEKRKDAIVRFLDAYRETIDYMYSDNPQVMRDYSEISGVPEPMARRVRDKFFVKSMLDPDKIHGLETIVPEAVKLKYTAVPLTTAQLTKLIQIPPRQR